MLEFFNFDAKWIGWIMEYVSTAYATILVNGSPSGEFKFERGLRQGDPSSPFLYLLIAEGLSILVARAVTMGKFEVAELGADKVVVSHLQYADDTIFIGRAKASNAITIWILKNFELLSGLKVNFQKCYLLGINIESQRLEAMTRFLNCAVGSFSFFFLVFVWAYTAKMGQNGKMLFIR